jgi:hypothetical protein
MKFGGIELAGPLGGYQIVNQPATSLPQDLATAIGVVNSGILGATYQPVWYVGKQVVNGINHFLLAEQIRTTKDQDKFIVGLVINIPAGDFTGEKATIVRIIEQEDLPAEVQDAYDATIGELLGVNYKPLMYIGKQVVNGINHYILCSAIGVYPGAEPYAVVVSINVPANGGKPFINKIEGIDSMNAVGYAFPW